MVYSPYVSPGGRFNTSKDSFAGFPPTFISVGTAEVLLDEIPFLSHLMKESIGTEVYIDEMVSTLPMNPQTYLLDDKISSMRLTICFFT